jgi:Asp/Glu/hydantoin racemase
LAGAHPRVALIHALAHSMAPVDAELDRAWPGCVRMHLLDGSLSADLAASAAGLDDAMTRRFVALAGYAISTGASGILFTCSAFGPCIEAVARRWPDVPVLKPNEAMIADAVRVGRRIGLVASFAPTLASMPAEFPAGVTVLPVLADGALDALTLGDHALHDRLVVEAARRAEAKGCDVVALAQFSLARAAPVVGHAVRVPVLTTVESAVRLLRERVKRRPQAQGSPANPAPSRQPRH